MGSTHKLGWAALAFVLAAGATGCGTPGAPQPPSLNLPERIVDLKAQRTGNVVSLNWTMPKKSTDKLLLKGVVMVDVCRKQGEGACDPAGPDTWFAPGVKGTFTETLPPALAAGAPRAVAYFVELKNHNGRSAGLSNDAVVLAGAAPAPVAVLVAQVRKDGVVLRWTSDGETTAIRLHRKLLTAQPNRKVKGEQGLLAAPPEPAEQNLLVETDPAAGRALDKNIHFGESYEYRAQRVARVTVNGKTLELDGEFSAPVRVEALDVFPPAVPTGLAAVATAPGEGTETSIDLSWQPVTEADLASYRVYRREGEGDWLRISPTQPFISPAFHDAKVQPGHTYHYAVSAIDQGGHESARSAEAEETVPTP